MTEIAELPNKWRNASLPDTLNEFPITQCEIHERAVDTCADELEAALPKWIQITKELQNLLSSASPGPWGIQENNFGCKVIIDGCGDSIMCTDGLHIESMDLANAKLVCLLRNKLESDWVDENWVNEND